MNVLMRFATFLVWTMIYTATIGALFLRAVGRLHDGPMNIAIFAVICLCIWETLFFLLTIAGGIGIAFMKDDPKKFDKLLGDPKAIQAYRETGKFGFFARRYR